MRKYFLVFFIVITTESSFPAFAYDSDGLPQKHRLTRYDRLWKHSPFDVKVTRSAFIKKNFASDLVVKSVLRVGDAYTVFVINKKTADQFILKSAVKGDSDIFLKEVEYDKNPLKVRVHLEQNGERAVIRYDENIMQQIKENTFFKNQGKSRNNKSTPNKRVTRPN